MIAVSLVYMALVLLSLGMIGYGSFLLATWLGWMVGGISLLVVSSLAYHQVAQQYTKLEASVERELMRDEEVH